MNDSVLKVVNVFMLPLHFNKALAIPTAAMPNTAPSGSVNVSPYKIPKKSKKIKLKASTFELAKKDRIY